MSKETVMEIQDSELRCYVCENIIHDLKRVRMLAKRKKEDAYYTDKALQVRQKVNLRVIEITGSLDKRRIFRHSRCNPNLKHFTTEDL